MFERIMKFFKNFNKKEQKDNTSKDTAKERLHLVLMQDRANVSADFLELMKQEIIEVIKKYLDVDEDSIDVRLTNKQNNDGTNGAPALYANIPILNVRNDMKKEKTTDEKEIQCKNEEMNQSINNENEEKLEQSEAFDEVENDIEAEKIIEEATEIVKESNSEIDNNDYKENSEENEVKNDSLNNTENENNNKQLKR